MADTARKTKRGRSGRGDTSERHIIAFRHNLPVQTLPFVGRTSELLDLLQLLSDPQRRLVTICAPAGMGKTTLALEAARRIVEGESLLTGWSGLRGVFYIPLGAVDDPDALLAAVADAVELRLRPEDDLREQFYQQVRPQRLLLLLDDLEPAPASAAAAAHILDAAPQITIVATSRERLNLPAETAFPLAGLETAHNARVAAESSATTLFTASAPADWTTQDIPQIARLCRLLEGIPLGIGLAAAWTALHPLDEIADEVERRIAYLQQQPELAAEDRALGAVLDARWEWLGEEEQLALTKLAVFRGGFTQDAAAGVANTPLRMLIALVNQALLRCDSISGRYDMHDVLRQYAQTRLDESPYSYDARCAHANFFFAFLQNHEDAPATQFIPALGGEWGNIRAAWAWALEHQPLLLWQGANVVSAYLTATARHHEAAGLFSSAAEAAAQWGGDDVLTALLEVNAGMALGRCGAHQDALGMADRAAARLETARHPAAWDVRDRLAMLQVLNT